MNSVLCPQLGFNANCVPKCFFSLILIRISTGVFELACLASGPSSAFPFPIPASQAASVQAAMLTHKCIFKMLLYCCKYVKTI